METKLKAKEIYDYMVMKLAEGVYISKKVEKEIIKELIFMIDTD